MSGRGRTSRERGVIVVAAGRSSRLPGDLPKPFLRVGRRSLLGHVLARLEESEVDHVVVVAPLAHLGRARAIARSYSKVTAVVAGGKLRQDSVRAGLMALPPTIRVVLVHDGARPCLTAAMVRATAAAAERHGAAICAAPVVDTLKEVARGRVVRTVDRAPLWRAETPQAFRRSWLAEGLARAESEGWEVTDDAALMERLGRSVRVVEAGAPNPKVTTAADLSLVAAILRGAS